VGYMYGSGNGLANNRKNTTDSTVKKVIDTWYDSTIKPTYDSYVSRTAIYCNDRANEGYSTSATFYYASYIRVDDVQSPSYKCGNDRNGNLYTGENGADIADKFTASTSTGNGKLVNPVALITADEAAFAGAKFNMRPTPYYYYNAAGGSVTSSVWWWTMSPYYWQSSTKSAGVFRMRGSTSSGPIDNVRVDVPYAVRPVLSLKSCVNWKSGDGTSSNPYEVVIDSVCEGLEN